MVSIGVIGVDGVQRRGGEDTMLVSGILFIYFNS